MKHIFTKYALLVLFAFPFIKQVNATPICLKGNYGDTYQLQFKRTDSLYIAGGKAFLNLGRVWPAWGFYNHQTGETELHVINPNPTGCSPYLDSFVNFMTGRGAFDENTGEYLFGATGYQRNYCGAEDLGGPDDYSIRDCNHASSLPQMNFNDASKNINGMQTTKYNAVTLRVSPNPISSSAVINYTLAEKSGVSIIIYDYSGKPVKALVNKETKDAGTYSASWDCKNSNNIPVNSGLYKIIAVINDKSYSSTVQVIR